MTVDPTDPKMAGYIPLQDFIDQDEDQSSRRIRDMPYGKRKEEMQISVSTLTFNDTVTNGESSGLVAVLTNSGYGEVNIYGHELKGDFILKSSLPAKLLPGETATVQLAFTPTALGARTGSIYFDTGNASGDEYVELNGTGVAATDVPADALLPPLVANTMLVDNADATARENKTFAQVRALLGAVSFSDLLYVDGNQNGLTGNMGEDQTVALQALIDGLPTEGGTIAWKGTADFTSIDLNARRNVRFEGIGGNGAGAGQRSQLRCTAGAIGAGNRAIDARDTMAFNLSRMYLIQSSTTFDGTLLDVGLITTGSALTSFEDFLINTVSQLGVAVNLYGCTQGSFRRGQSTGGGVHWGLQDVSGVGFCNVHKWDEVHMKPTGIKPPVFGSGEGLTFQSCNVQAAYPAGYLQFWETSQNQDFRDVNILGCTFYDALHGQYNTIRAYRGNVFNFIGNRMGGSVAGGNAYGLNIGGGTGGVKCLNVIGNNFDGMTAGLAFAGTIAAGTGVDVGRAGGNYCNGATLMFSNHLTTVVQRFIMDPNYVATLPNGDGARLNLKLAVPTSSAGLVSGAVWNNGGVLTMVP